MQHYLRDRLLIPALLPLGAAVVIAAVAINFSRVLLTVDKSPAVVIGILTASGVLAFGVYLSRQASMGPGSVLATFAAGALVVSSGLIAYGIEEDGKPSHGAEQVFAGPKLTVTAFDIGFREKALTAAPGETEITYLNEGAPHTLVIEGVAGFKLEVDKKGDVDKGVVELDAGAFTYFCDLPGHRGSGMQGTLTVQ